MTPRQMLETLNENRRLDTREQVAAFEKALDLLATHQQAAEHLRELHLVLDDQTKQAEVMFGVIHLLESFDVERQLQAFLEALPMLQKQAPGWVKTLNFRLLNDEASRSAYRAAYRAAGSPVRGQMSVALAEIIETEQSPLRDYACEVVTQS